MNAERPHDVPALNGHTSHRDALASFEAAAWRQVARGDWARVVASPDRRRVVRVALFDPGWRLHLRARLDHPANPYLPRIHWHTDLASVGLDVRPGNVMSDRAGHLLCAFLEIPPFDWGEPEQLAIELRGTIEALC